MEFSTRVEHVSTLKKVANTTLKWSFAGCRNQGIKTLSALIESGFKPNLVAILPESTSAEIDAFSALARECGADFIISKDLKDQVAILKESDLLLVCRFNILSKEVFFAPRWGAINIHLGLLPHYRGVHPVSWALVNGEKNAGFTIHSIDSGVDTGKILRQGVVDISDNDDIWSLTDKLEQVSIKQTVELFKYIVDEGSLPKGQPQIGKGFYARRRTPEDGKIDWTRKGREIFNLVRALQEPLPNAFAYSSEGKKIEVLRCNLTDRPGTVLAKFGTNSYLISCGDSLIIIETCQPLHIGEVLT